MSAPSSKVDAFVSRAKKWQGETQKLRSILLDCGLGEDLKWGKPCFTFEGRNVAIIQPFKEHCSLMFFKGALLKDTHGLLRSQGENTQSAMRLEFTSEAQIKKSDVSSYVKQAIAVEDAGLAVDTGAKRERASQAVARDLPDFTGLVDSYGDAVVNVAVVGRSAQAGSSDEQALLEFQVQPNAFHSEWRRRVGLQ